MKREKIKTKKSRRKKIKVIKAKVNKKGRKSEIVKVRIVKNTREKNLVLRFALKTVVVLLIVCLNWTGLSAVLNTIAYFSDSELSSGVYEVGSLDFSLRSGQSNFVPVENMIPGSSAARDIYIKKEGTLPFGYKTVSGATSTDCDLDLYDNLELKVWYNYYTATPTDPGYHDDRVMVLKYNGLLKDFETDPTDLDLIIPNSHSYFYNKFYELDEHWFYYNITLPEGVPANLQNKNCQFKFLFDGWQAELTASSSGFSDMEEITGSLSTGDWSPQAQVVYPNGGETWYIVPDSCPDNPLCSAWCQSHGMNENCEYNLQWLASNSIGSDEDLLIDIYYSADSGNSWLAQIVNGTENDGTFLWKIPWDSSYISDQARIKVVATHKDYPTLTDWDMSDADFCPPMLSEAEIMMMMFDPEMDVSASSNGGDNLPELPEENGSVEQEITTEEFIEEDNEVKNEEELEEEPEIFIDDDTEKSEDPDEFIEEEEEQENADIPLDILLDEENAETTDEIIEEDPEENAIAAEGEIQSEEETKEPEEEPETSLPEPVEEETEEPIIISDEEELDLPDSEDEDPDEDPGEPETE